MAYHGLVRTYILQKVVGLVVSHLRDSVLQESASIAELGGGGMSKSD